MASLSLKIILPRISSLCVMFSLCSFLSMLSFLTVLCILLLTKNTKTYAFSVRGLGMCLPQGACEGQRANYCVGSWPLYLTWLKSLVSRGLCQANWPVSFLRFFSLSVSSYHRNAGVIAMVPGFIKALGFWTQVSGSSLPSLCSFSPCSLPFIRTTQSFRRILFTIVEYESNHSILWQKKKDKNQHRD